MRSALQRFALVRFAPLRVAHMRSAPWPNGIAPMWPSSKVPRKSLTKVNLEMFCQRKRVRAEIRPAEVRLVEVRLKEVRPAKVRSGEARSPGDADSQQYSHVGVEALQKARAALQDLGGIGARY